MPLSFPSRSKQPHPATSLALAGLILLVAPTVTAQTLPASGETISPDDARIILLGRNDATDPKHPRLAFPGVTIRLRFTGDSLIVNLASDTATSAVDISIDGADPQGRVLEKGSHPLRVAENLDGNGKELFPHTVDIVKRTETWQGIVTFSGITLAPNGKLLPPIPLPVRKLLFIGDSVTCGAAADRPRGCADSPLSSNGDASYGMRLGRLFDAQAQLVCYGGRGLVRDYRGLRDVLNAPQFFEMSVPADDPAQRSGWKPDGWTPDAIVISLGTNDFNLQAKDPISQQEFVAAYLPLVQRMRQLYPRALVFLTEGAIVTNPLLRQYVQQAVKEAGDPQVRWMQAVHYPGDDCNGHPTRAQHLRMAEDMEPVLRQALGW